MDITKIQTTKQLNYRIPKHLESHSLDLIATLTGLTDYGHGPDTSEVQALDFLGMLWTAVEVDKLPQKPRTKAERAYMVELEARLDSILKGSQLDWDSETRKLGVTEEMYERTKRLLLALYFAGLTPYNVQRINTGEFKTCVIKRGVAE